MEEITGVRSPMTNNHEGRYNGDHKFHVFDLPVPLGKVPAFSCRHYLLSNLLSGKITTNDLSLRLVDEQATLLMSVIHLDYERRDIAADHGSDRFSTFSEFTCESTA